MKIVMRLTLLSLLVAIGGARASADMPGQHPPYLRALADLRAARAHIDSHGPSEKRDTEENLAIRQIDAAIAETQRAASKDGKDIKEPEPVDVHLERANRYSQAHQLLDSARQDVSGKEDDPHARGLQKNAIFQIDGAIHTLENLQKKYR